MPLNPSLFLSVDAKSFHCPAMRPGQSVDLGLPNDGTPRKLAVTVHANGDIAVTVKPIGQSAAPDNKYNTAFFPTGEAAPQLNPAPPSHA